VICKYCGLEAAEGVNHRSQAECIAALHRAIDAAKGRIEQQRVERPRRPASRTITSAAPRERAADEPAQPQTMEDVGEGVIIPA
jgi:hypothetical protein